MEHLLWLQVILLGAILAVVVIYARRLLGVLVALPRDPAARHFTIAILLAFLPAAVIGVAAHGFIKSVLFSPWAVAVSLVVGGLLTLVGFIAAFLVALVVVRALIGFITRHGLAPFAWYRGALGALAPNLLSLR